ncbi:OmpA family protein [Altererythrobacter sp. H2]|uniref:OmpA family protein n=1 Tax=Altererythrobacter sp. H2 TaxID=3108391 RepID=UPI002B4C21A0|nr:OmpA family protein [Altererythrobacter sp. H2]WRK94679.1 OmpA family protein [Altererythrobacter sp. H2]
MSAKFPRRALILSVLASAILTACQTVPPAPFSAQQVAVLESKGFREQGGNYLLGLQNRVLFGFDSSELQGETSAMLGELGRELAGVGIRSAGVEGHASAEGGAEYNLLLSQRRAEAVSRALVDGGLIGTAMRVRGMGALDPVAPNDSEEGRSQNRRVVIVVTPADAMALK